MPFKYWPYAFRHMLVIERNMPPSNKYINHIEAIVGNRPLGKRLRKWGCRVWIRKKGRRSSILAGHSIKGRFLGCAGTTKNIIYLDETNNNIKKAKSAIFDVLFSDLNKSPPKDVSTRPAIFEFIAVFNV